MKVLLSPIPLAYRCGCRTFDSESYRYGLTEGKGRQGRSSMDYDYGFRIYNQRIAKFLSVEPLTASYPWCTPIQLLGNMPVWAAIMDCPASGMKQF